MSTSPHSVVWALGTAVPRFRISQERALGFMSACHAGEEATQRRLKAIYRRAQIDYRHSCCADFAFTCADTPTDGGEPLLFGAEGGPGLTARMQRYERESVPLAQTAAMKAFEGAGASVARSDVTHLITVTCTGFFAPGLDLELVDRLGLSRSIQRLQVGFMGCQAALHGLQMADAICRADGSAVVLLVCVELTTLHFRRESDVVNLIINSLFGDGAAAALIIGAQRVAGGQALLSMDGFYSYVVPDTAEFISWRIEQEGFRMGLSAKTPGVLGQVLPDFVRRLLGPTGRSDSEVEGWAIHPGGRAILDAAADALTLPPGKLSTSREVLRCFGNMSSPTILFVLDRLVRTAANGVALTFGPGLSVEGMVWTRGSRGG